jgi:TonB family protein
VTLALALVTGLSPRSAAQNSAQSPAKGKRKVVVSVAPDYPYVLRNGHFEGQVKLEATVQPNGNVTKVDIKGGNPMLSQYAQMAVMRWKYAPGPNQTVEEVVFTFNPNEK